MNQKRTGAGCGEGVRRKQRASREQGRLLPIQQPVSEQGMSEPMVCKTIVLSTQTPSLVGGGNRHQSYNGTNKVSGKLSECSGCG